MFRDVDVALLDLKIIVKGAAPCAFRKSLTLAGAELIGRRILPVHVIARFPAVMGHVIDLDAGLAGRAHNGAQVVEKIDLLRHVLDPGPELAALAQEIVVEIDAEKRRDLGVVGRGHDVFLHRKGTPEASKKIDNEYNLFWPVTIVCKAAFLQPPTPAYRRESRSSSERNNDYGSLIARAGAEKPAEDRGVRRSPLPRVRRGQRLGSRGHERRRHDDRRLLQAFRIEGRPGRGGLLSYLRAILGYLAPGFRTQIRRSGPPIGRH